MGIELYSNWCDEHVDEQTPSYNPPFEDNFLSQHLQVFTPSPLNVNVNKFSSFSNFFGSITKNIDLFKLLY
jgi:hypothetical protein